MKKSLKKFNIKKYFKGFNIKKFFKGFPIKNVLKLFGFKNLLIVTLTATIVLMVLLGTGMGFGKGTGSEEGDGNSKVEINRDNSLVIEVMENITVPTIEPIQQPTIIEEKKDIEVLERVILAITVVGNDYFYNNERVLLENFIVIIKGVEGKVIVEVKDDNASLKAYNNLLDELDEMNIEYINK